MLTRAGRSSLFSATAISISSSLAWALHTSHLPLRVLGVHDRACNLLTADDRLIALVHPSLGHGPFHILVDLPRPFTDLFARTSKGYISSGTLSVGRVRVTFHRAMQWQPRISRPLLDPAPGRMPISRARVVNLVDEVLAATERPESHVEEAVRAIARTALGRIVRAIERQDRRGVQEALARLIGLGPGLTPAGDDVVLGMLAGLWTWGSDGLPANQVGQLAVTIARRQTNRLSLEWLRWAAAGAFAEPWHHLTEGLRREDEARVRQALQRILNTGASSGEYALYGLRAVSLYMPTRTASAPPTRPAGERPGPDSSAPR